MFYYDATHVLVNPYTFCFIFGGRGIGKTYSLLRETVLNQIPHIYLRTRDSEIQMCMKREINPYKSINIDYERNVEIVPNGGIPIIVENEKQLGIACSLSTFGKLRGADYREIELIIYDEFGAPEQSQKLKNISDLFFNFYETVNRNREISGKPAVKMIMLSNAITMDTDILRDLGLVEVLETMKRRGQKVYRDNERSVYIELIGETEISSAKRGTALYRLTNGTKFYDHAINNEFYQDSWYNVRKRPLVEYVPYIALCGLYIYQHKSNGKMYACHSRCDCPEYTEHTLALFRRNHYMPLREMYIAGKMEFSSFTAKTEFIQFMGHI